MSRRITSSLKPVSCEMAETANERKHKMRARNSCGIVLLVLTFLCSCNSPFANNIGRKGDFITAFGGKTLEPKYRDVHVSYGLDPKNERYLVHVPESYTKSSPRFPMDGRAYSTHTECCSLLRKTAETTKITTDGWVWLC